MRRWPHSPFHTPALTPPHHQRDGSPVMCRSRSLFPHQRVLQRVEAAHTALHACIGRELVGADVNGMQQVSWRRCELCHSMQQVLLACNTASWVDRLVPATARRGVCLCQPCHCHCLSSNVILTGITYVRALQRKDGHVWTPGHTPAVCHRSLQNYR